MCKIGANLEIATLCKKVAFSNVCSVTSSQNFTGTFPLSSHQDSAFDPLFLYVHKQ